MFTGWGPGDVTIPLCQRVSADPPGRPSVATARQRPVAHRLGARLDEIPRLTDRLPAVPRPQVIEQCCCPLTQLAELGECSQSPELGVLLACEHCVHDGWVGVVGSPCLGRSTYVPRRCLT